MEDRPSLRAVPDEAADIVALTERAEKSGSAYQRFRNIDALLTSDAPGPTHWFAVAEEALALALTALELQRTGGDAA